MSPSPIAMTSKTIDAGSVGARRRRTVAAVCTVHGYFPEP